MSAGADRLDPWAPGRHGKFLITAGGAFHHWPTEGDLAPHHAVVAERLGVTSWIVGGLIDPDGALEPTAMVPGTDLAAVLAGVAAQYEPLGIHRRST
jgi:hypothetical protein